MLAVLFVTVVEESAISLELFGIVLLLIAVVSAVGVVDFEGTVFLEQLTSPAMQKIKTANAKFFMLAFQ